ncbi:MAG: hypothetical protein VW125_01120 [Flavobacteriaceae bacterium]
MLKWTLKIVFSIGFIVASIVVGIMYHKLSFIDWPYVIVGVVLFVAAVLIPVKKQNK